MRKMMLWAVCYQGRRREGAKVPEVRLPEKVMMNLTTPRATRHCQTLSAEAKGWHKRLDTTRIEPASPQAKDVSLWRGRRRESAGFEVFCHYRFAPSALHATAVLSCASPGPHRRFSVAECLQVYQRTHS